MTANRVERASTKRKRRAPLVLIVVPIALVAAAALVILLLQGGEVPIIGSEEEPVPEFDFTVKRSVAVATAPDADVAALTPEAEAVSSEITPAIDDLYTSAFIDPSSWREGDYEDVFAAFAPGAVAAAHEHVGTLTLGTTAGDDFESVDPRKGFLTYEVLFDRDGNPDTTVVAVRFTALGERTDGTFVEIVSEGQYFLQEIDGWKITAFDVTRSDEETEPPPSASTSPSA
ncbi:MAG TPA: hypothetical protein VJ913_06390 [Actinomycetota bacterium]|nr:hypothetical protein [Actinomycetota bacterium]